MIRDGDICSICLYNVYIPANQKTHLYNIVQMLYKCFAFTVIVMLCSGLYSEGIVAGWWLV